LDIVWKEDKRSKQLTILESNEDLIVWTESEIIDESGQPVGLTWSEFWSGALANQTGDIFHAFLGRWESIIPSSLLYKRANLGGIRYDERLKYANDYKLNLDLFEEPRCYVC
jgi:hypothetical protein